MVLSNPAWAENSFFTLIARLFAHIYQEITAEFGPCDPVICSCGRASSTALLRVESQDRPMDPYKILGIERTAARSQIEAAYREKAKKYHPERGGDPWAFEQVQVAYESLTRNGAGAPDFGAAGFGGSASKSFDEDSSLYAWPARNEADAAGAEPVPPHAAMLAAGGILGGVAATVVAYLVDLSVVWSAGLGFLAGIVLAHFFVPKQ